MRSGGHEALRIIFRFFAAIILVIIISAPVFANAETTLIPLPVYATSRNGGNDYGFMPVWLFKQQNEYVYGILAPSIIYNGNTGWNMTFRYLGYPTMEKNYRIFVNRSTKVDQEYTGEYWDNKFLGGRFRLYGRASFFRDSTYRFFGLTEKSKSKDETDYSNLEFTPEFKLGYYLPRNFLVSYGEKFKWITVRRGTVTSLPYIQSRFPDLNGVNGGAVWARRITLSYDTRDDEVYPSKGWYANAYTGIDHVFTHNRLYSKTGIDVRKFISLGDKRYTTVIKGAFEITGGHRPPFYEESWIGGENTLRGEGTYRFRFARTDDRIVARVELDDADGALLVTSVGGEFAPASAARQRRAFYGQPAMTLGVIVRIHWQALKLMLKRVPFFSKPPAPLQALSHGAPSAPSALTR